MKTANILTAGALAVMLGIAGCAAAPAENASATASAADIATLQEYSAITVEVKTLFDEASAAARRYDSAALEDVGSDLVDIGMRGPKLPDIPMLGPTGNKAWDDTMDDLFTAGADLMLGKFDRAATEIESANSHLREVTAAITAITESL